MSEEAVVIGCDHAAYEMKEKLKAYLTRRAVAVEDAGTYGTESVDYPDYAAKVARAVVGGNAQRGILVCGSGIGMQIAANKVTGARAALAWSEETARLARLHNDANIVAVGARTTEPETVDQIIRTFLSTEFEGGRHQRRLDKITGLEHQKEP